jgi:BirA family biotin operon repressor/biotin-[acetyl-CoA-carboxylase] ligase
VTSLNEQGAYVTPEDLFAHLYREMAAILEIWDEGRAVAAVTDLWREVACGIGEAIRVNLPDRSLVGHFAGIDDQGLLILDTGRELLPIAAGDVFFA